MEVLFYTECSGKASLKGTMAPYGCLGKKFFPCKGSCTFKCIKAIVQCSNSQTVILRSYPQDAFIGSEFKTVFVMTLTLFVFLLGFFLH